MNNKNDYISILDSWKNDELKIVFTNGCFDILHRGHIDYLSEAAKFGERLIVGLNSDHSVRQIKGENRPIQSEEDRYTVLSALKMVDLVIIFQEQTPLKLIKSIKPDVLVKGGDYSFETIVGASESQGWGGDVKIIPLTEGKGTSGIIKKIQSDTLSEMS